MHPANECISINLLRPSSASEKPEPAFEEPFPPKFTYWFLPDQDEQIIGYSQPKITVDFRANDLKPSISIKYKKKEDFSQMLGKQQADIDAAFAELFPACTLGTKLPLKNKANEEQRHLTPPPPQRLWDRILPRKTGNPRGSK
jgi:histone acetyltransferase 1